MTQNYQRQYSNSAIVESLVSLYTYTHHNVLHTQNMIILNCSHHKQTRIKLHHFNLSKMYIMYVKCDIAQNQLSRKTICLLYN